MGCDVGGFSLSEGDTSQFHLTLTITIYIMCEGVMLGYKGMVDAGDS